MISSLLNVVVAPLFQFSMMNDEWQRNGAKNPTARPDDNVDNCRL